MSEETRNTPLHDYIKQNPGFVRVYQNSEANQTLVNEIQATMPEARLLVICEFWCGDCRRHAPRVARIVERLPGWQVEVHPWDSAWRGKPWQVRAIPTFILMNGEQELGRIVENPTHGSLEEDLLAISRGV